MRAFQVLIMMLIGLRCGPVLAGCSEAAVPPPVATAPPSPGSPAPSVVQVTEVANRVVLSAARLL